MFESVTFDLEPYAGLRIAGSVVAENCDIASLRDADSFVSVSVCVVIGIMLFSVASLKIPPELPKASLSEMFRRSEDLAKTPTFEELENEPSRMFHNSPG